MDGPFYVDSRAPWTITDVASVTLATTDKAMVPLSNLPVLGSNYFWAGKLVRINMIGRITTAGAITEFATPVLGLAGPGCAIASGPGGALWILNGSNIVQIVVSPAGTIKPVSHVSPLPATEPVANFTVQWSGTVRGPSLQQLIIYVSDNGAPFSPWLTYYPVPTVPFPNPFVQPPFSATYPGVLGHSYSFYSIARDWAGNQEDAKTVAEASTVVIQAPGDVNGDGAVNCSDFDLVKASFGTRAGQPGYNPQADANHDGVVDIRDLSYVTRYLPVGTKCP